MTTMYLNPSSWDLDVDAARNIALAADPYATAQSVANACRLWVGEAPFNADRGIPYETEILGQQPPPRLLAPLPSRLRTTALGLGIRSFGIPNIYRIPVLAC